MSQIYCEKILRKKNNEQEWKANSFVYLEMFACKSVIFFYYFYYYTLYLLYYSIIYYVFVFILNVY